MSKYGFSAGYDVIAAATGRAGNSLQCDVVGLGRSGSEDDLFRLSSDESRDFATRLLHG